MSDRHMAVAQRRLAELLDGYSVEVSARHPAAIEHLRDHFKPGTEVYISLLADDDLARTVEAAAKIRRAGYTPVPHLAARASASLADLGDHLARAAGEAGVGRALLIAGDLDLPRGPFSSTLELIETGLLQSHGITSIGVAGHPEGMRKLPTQMLEDALAAKLALARRTGIRPWIVTQFCFEAAPIVGWLGRLRARGSDAPVRIGIAGRPASARSSNSPCAAVSATPCGRCGRERTTSPGCSATPDPTAWSATSPQPSPRPRPSAARASMSSPLAGCRKPPPGPTPRPRRSRNGRSPPRAEAAFRLTGRLRLRPQRDPSCRGLDRQSSRALFWLDEVLSLFQLPCNHSENGPSPCVATTRQRRRSRGGEEAMSDKDREADQGHALREEQAVLLERVGRKQPRPVGRRPSAQGRYAPSASPRDDRALRDGQAECSDLLLGLGDAGGTTGLVELLTADDPQMPRQALGRVGTLLRCQRHGDYQAFDKQAVFPPVVQLLDSSDRTTSEWAFDALVLFDTEESKKRVAEQITHPHAKIRAQVARRLARRGEDGGSVAVIEALLSDPTVDPGLLYDLTYAVENLCEHGDSSTRERACRIAMKFVRSRLGGAEAGAGDPKPWEMRGYINHCLSGTAAAAPADEHSLLLEVLHANPEWGVQGTVLQRLAELEGASGVERLCDALADKRLCADAAEGLTRLARHSGNPRVIDALAAALESPTSEGRVGEIVRALLAVGGTPRPILEKALTRVGPDDAMSVRWLIEGIGPKDLARSLVAAGAMVMPTEAEMAEYEALWRDKQSAVNLLWEKLARAERFLWFDCKSDDWPADHARLVERFSQASGHEFEVEDVSQIVEPEEVGDCKVSFMHDGRRYSFTARHGGRFYDLPTVFNSLNEVLRGNGRKERFFQLYNGGQIAFIVFALEDQFMEAVRDVGIPLETDPDAAHRRHRAESRMRRCICAGASQSIDNARSSHAPSS